MKDDIKNIIKILNKIKRSDLAELLKESRGEVDESSTYGSYLFSLISNYIFYLPLDNFYKAKQLNENDKKILLETVLYLYPHQSEAPEIVNIDFRLMENVNCDEVIAFGNGDIIDYDFIEEQLEKSERKIKEGDYDGAITNAHSLLQGVLADIYKKCTGNKLKKSGDIRNDYKEIKKLLNFSEEKFSNESIVSILRGLNNIICGLDAVGNQLGDRHRRLLKPAKHHAKLVVNSARIISDFLYDSFNYQNKKNK